jgi:hypothetical protein
MLRLAYFISPHGFGHATRAAAIMGALQTLAPDVQLDLFTLAPEWLFQVSLSRPFTYHSLMSDIGLVQKSPLEEDLAATLQRLGAFLPFDMTLVKHLARQITQTGCQLVVCDIAPLGVAVAEQASLPSILIENFTWDWIYEGYLEAETGFTPYIEYLRRVFRSASYHIQTEPVSNPALADLVTHPVSRAPRTPKSQTRQDLGIPEGAPMILVTMGGIESPLTFASHPAAQDSLYFVVPGGSPNGAAQNRILLPHHSDFYHPDLVHASDAIVGKAGYSTLSEAYQAGVPYIYTARHRFRETASLTAFIQQELGGFEIQEREFLEGSWIPDLVEILKRPKRLDQRQNGAEQAAKFILGLFA